MNHTHWRNLNILWNPAVYEYWEANGCMGEIRRRVGYRFVLMSATAPVSVPAGGSMRLHLEIANAGFATPLNERLVEAVLRHVGTGRTHFLPLDADPRRWWNGETHHYPFSVQLPADVTPGDKTSLSTCPMRHRGCDNFIEQYSIRFANIGTWEDATGFHNLGLRVSVTP